MEWFIHNHDSIIKQWTLKALTVEPKASQTQHAPPGPQRSQRHWTFLTPRDAWLLKVLLFFNFSAPVSFFSSSSFFFFFLPPTHSPSSVSLSSHHFICTVQLFAQIKLRLRFSPSRSTYLCFMTRTKSILCCYWFFFPPPLCITLLLKSTQTILLFALWFFPLLSRGDLKCTAEKNISDRGWGGCWSLKSVVPSEKNEKWKGTTRRWQVKLGSATYQNFTCIFRIRKIHRHI